MIEDKMNSHRNKFNRTNDTLDYGYSYPVSTL